MLSQRIGACLSCVLAIVSTNQAADDAVRPTVCVDGPRVNLVARSVPLAIPLDRFTGACSVRISFRRGDRAPSTLVVHGETAFDALENLTAGHDAIVVFAGNRVEAVYLYGNRSDAPARTAAVALDFAAEGNTDAAHAADQSRSAAAVEGVEKMLRSNAAGYLPDAGAPSELLKDPDPNIRATALQWTVGKGEEYMDALAVSLVDADSTVQSAAQQLLLNNGISDDGMAEIFALAESGDRSGIRDLLPSLLASRMESAPARSSQMTTLAPVSR